LTVRIEHATRHHVALFAHELTDEDDLEARACGAANAVQAFAQLLEESLEGYAAVVANDFGMDRVGAMLGLRARPDGDGAQLWFHSTELFKRYPLAFLKPCRRLFDQLLERHPVVHGMINPDNPAMIRLSTWLGFELGGVEEHGAFRFHPAVIRRQTHG
jgi:RimJ/RimL family protein N-acetyltransferase